MTDIQPSTGRPSRADSLFQVAVIEAMIADLEGRKKDLRKYVGEDIAAQYDETGEKCAVDVRIPGTKTVVGKVSTSIANASTTVADADALLEWAQTHKPSEVEYVSQVKPAFLAVLLKNVTWSEDPDNEGQLIAELLDNSTGETITVPGLKHNPGGAYKSFSIGQRKNDLILDALGAVGIRDVLGSADAAIEGFATITGEAAPAPEVVASEVVTKGEEAAA